MVSRERLNPMDAMLLYLETPTSSSTIGVICRFDGPVSFADFVKDFRSRRIQRLRRFRQVIAPVPLNLGFPTWEDDPDFELERHLRRACLDAPGSERQLGELANRVLEERFDFSKPPWSVVLVDGLHDGSSALIFHMHHCITDGIGFQKILQVIFDATPERFMTSDCDETPVSPSPLPGPLQRLGGALRDRFVRPSQKRLCSETAAEAAERKARDKRRLAAFNLTMKEFFLAKGIQLPFNVPLSGRVHHCTVAFDLDGFRHIAKAVHCTVNDVLLAVLAGAVDRLSEELQIDVTDKNCRVYQAADARSADEKENWGNRLAFMPALLPLGQSDSCERLRSIANYTKKVKELGVREATDKLIRVFQSALPPPVAKLGLRLMLSRSMQAIGKLSKRPPTFNIYMSNVYLPQFNSFLGGRRMMSIVGFAPLVPNTGVTLTAATFDGRLNVGITADAVSMPDAEGFAAKLTAAYEELWSAIQDTLPSSV